MGQEQDRLILTTVRSTFFMGAQACDGMEKSTAEAVQFDTDR